MSKKAEDTQKEVASGLLAKIVKFVGSPATSWSGSDSVQLDSENALSKQLLNEMIERKRRNDFVRKREFDLLRKLREHEALVTKAVDPDAKASTFQNSIPSKPYDRAKTLKKIDEIEAQMSMQWWKTKHENSLLEADQPREVASGRSTRVGFTALDATDKGAEHPVDSVQNALLLLPEDFDSAVKISTSVQTNAISGHAEYQNAIPIFLPSGISLLAATNAVKTAEAVEAFTHDLELEEAAIRFANGDHAGAEAGLLEILAPGASRENHVETWLTLFDFYRATAQQEKFEAIALAFAVRFDRSAPQWFSMPDMAKAILKPAGKLPDEAAANWRCPSVVDMKTVAALNAVLLEVPMPWCLDWSNLKTIKSVAVAPLLDIFSAWADQPVQLQFVGDTQLQQVLRNATPFGVRETPQNWWHLRMTSLRVTNQADDFELAALDFCVTYEISPPDWKRARSEYRSLDQPDGSMFVETMTGEADRDSEVSTFIASYQETQPSHGERPIGHVLAAELCGQIEGDLIVVLDQLETQFKGADLLVISCSALIRVDFSAAGTLLNWVTARQAENISIQFSDVNRLVAAFFSVIGITEHSKVIVRND